eukprot:5979773-Prymnesium_polylepis.1
MWAVACHRRVQEADRSRKRRRSRPPSRRTARTRTRHPCPPGCAVLDADVPSHPDREGWQHRRARRAS